MLQAMTNVSMALISLLSTQEAVKSATKPQNDSQNVLKLNQISKGSIAASWVELPDSCKAKNFNADPDITDTKVQSKQVRQIFSTLG